MSIVFTCPLCREENSVGPEFAGRHGTCAFCGAALIVPQTSGLARAAQQPAELGQQKSAFPWVIVVVVACVGFLFCGGILAGLLLPAVSSAREAGRRAACMNNLKQIGLAMQNYLSTQGHFPPAADTHDGRPPMSWRIAILPYIDEFPLYQQYDPQQPWNSSKNLAFVKQMPRLYRCPSDGSPGDGETS